MGWTDWTIVGCQAAFGLLALWVAASGLYTLSTKPKSFEREMEASAWVFFGSVGGLSCLVLLPWTIFMITPSA